MKFLKVLGGILLALIIGLVILVLVCANHPELTEKIAGFLYPDRYRIEETESGMGEGESGAEDKRDGAGNPERNAAADSQPAVSEDVFSGGQNEERENAPEQEKGAPAAGKEGLAENIRPEYIAPDEAELTIPEKVSGRNGYQQVQGEAEQVDDEAAKALENQLGPGQTGDGLSFDALFYPYYEMLDEQGSLCAGGGSGSGQTADGF